MKKAVLILVLSIAAIPVIEAQDTKFDLDIYRQFISDNEDIYPAELYELYPSDIFMDSVVPFLKEDVLFLELANDLYKFTPGEMNLLHKNGFD